MHSLFISKALQTKKYQKDTADTYVVKYQEEGKVETIGRVVKISE